MLDGWTDAFCGSAMCFGAKEAMANLYHEPAATEQRGTIPDSQDDASSYCPYEQRKSTWHPVHSPSKVPSVIRVDSPVAPSTPIRDCVSTEREPPSTPIKHMLPSSKQRLAEMTTPPSHFRKQWEETFRLSPSLLLKKANPVMKENDDSTDDETVSTQSTQSSYSLSLSSLGEGSESRLEWRKSSSRSQQRSTTKLNWNDAVIEDTTEGFRIHGPPELLRAPMLQKEEDWVFETPKRAKKQNVNKKFQLRLRTSKAPSPPYLPRLD